MSQDAMLEQIEVLYRGGLSQFVRVATAVTGSREAGRDAVQEAFLTAIRRRRQYRGEGSVEAWLWKVVVTSALKARRSSNAISLTPTPPERPSNGVPDDGLDEVRVAVALLPDRQRMVLFLRYYADLDYHTIADALDVRPGTVAAALNAAHTTLRRRLKEVSSYD